MFHICQTTSVQDYVEHFSSLFDQLKAYEPNPDLHYYTTRFVDGLRADIRAVVTLQHPDNLDTAYLLALLQEEVGDFAKKFELHAYDCGASTKGPGQHGVPRPPPTQATAEKPVMKAPVPASKDKMTALRTYRRGRGLCDFCAEKWFRSHKCAPTIPLHAMQLFLAISHEAQQGSHGCLTIQFLGSVCNIAVTVLVDSGSSASFLATTIADQLIHLPRMPLQASVKVANGHILHCTTAIQGCEFRLGEHSFQHDLRILPLDSYDLILGMDWLELFSPMEVHWKAKWLSLPYNGRTVFLQGLTASSDEDMIFQIMAMEDTCTAEADATFPPEISALLKEFEAVFTVPSSLPPKRSWDHAIPLIKGATQVNIRAYHYPPSLKDEIERQVNTMLEQGLIQPSKSPFSSLVLLVRKKDGT
jgi:hypothetical protein